MQFIQDQGEGANLMVTFVIITLLLTLISLALYSLFA